MSPLLFVGAHDASAARSSSRLRVTSIPVDGLTDVALNHPIQVRFSARISGASLKDGSIAIVPFDAESETTGDARPVTLKRRGNVVQLIPVLPTHAIDPASPRGDFYAPGTPNDDAFENGTLRAGSDYQIVIGGRKDSPAVKSITKAKLRETAIADFRTAERGSSAPLFLPEEWVVAPPPRVLFANPLDRVPTASRVYADIAGTPAVPTYAHITVFCNGVGIDPVALREPGAVQLLRVAPLGPDEVPAAVSGDVVVEQDRNRTTLVFRPAAPLDELSTYALRIAETVTDVTGEFTLQPHPGRDRLGKSYQFLAASRRVNPSIPPEHLPDPPADQVFDWPSSADVAARGELKVRLLEVGDMQPWALDPRVFAVFTTRREILTAAPAEAGPAAISRRSAALAKVTRQVTPIGLQGVAGADMDGHVVLPFTFVDRKAKDGTIELEYGVDTNADGTIDDDEFRPLTADRIDARNTGAASRRGGKRGLPFVTAPDSGRSNAVVWSSFVDVGNSAFPGQRVLHTRQGREIEDPNNPGTPMFAPPAPGVVVRMRSIRGRRKSSAWTYTEPFELHNGSRPAIAIDDVVTGDTTSIEWRAFDTDGEDFNGNGLLDPLDGEDINGNGLLDIALASVAFDYVVLGESEDADELTADELAALDWTPCSRASGLGDPDDGVSSARTGLAYTFAWDHEADEVAAGSRVILRGSPFDETALRGQWIYRTEPTTIGE